MREKPQFFINIIDIIIAVILANDIYTTKYLCVFFNFSISKEKIHNGTMRSSSEDITSTYTTYNNLFGNENDKSHRRREIPRSNTIGSGGMHALKNTLVKNSMSVDFLRKQQSIEEEIEVREGKCSSHTLPYILCCMVLLVTRYFSKY